MAFNSYKLATIYSYPHRARPYLASWIAASKLLRQALDPGDQPLCPRGHRAYFSQHGNPLLLRKLPVPVDWGEEFPHSLLWRRDTGEYLLYLFRPIAPFHSHRCLRSRLRPRRSAYRDETKVESLYLPHTSPAPPLGSSHWRFPHPLSFPSCSLAGSSWWSVSWLSSRLCLQEKRALFRLVCPSTTGEKQ